MKVISKIHYKRTVYRVDEFDGKHKDICICHHGCEYFEPNSPADNCSIAQMSFELSKMAGIVLVHSCKYYEKGE